jgi:CBS domain-containing protein
VGTSDHLTRRIPREQALALTVGDVMIAEPKTLAPNVTVGDVRRAFENASQRVVLIADGTSFRGAIERTALRPDAPDAESALPYATSDIRAVTPSTSIADAITQLERNAEPRLVVLSEDRQTLCGLLCFNRGSASFCVA